MNDKVEPSDAVIEADLEEARVLTEELTELSEQDRNKAIDALKLRASYIEVLGDYAHVSPEAANATLEALDANNDSPDSKREIDSILGAPQSDRFMGDTEGRHVQLSEAAKNPLDAQRLRSEL